MTLIKEKSKQFMSIKEASWISVLLVLLMTFLSIPTFFISNELGKKVLELLVYVFSSLLMIYYIKKKHDNLELRFSRIELGDILLLAPLAVFMSVITEFISGLIPISPQAASILSRMFSYSPVTFILTVFFAPFLEEILCRGLILQGLTKNYSNFKSIFWSAFIFGSIHLNPWQFITGFILGILSGWIFLKYSNLVPCIFIHFVTNLFSMLMEILFPEYSGFGKNTTKLLLGNNDFFYTIVLIFSLVLGSFCIYMIQKRIKRPVFQ